MKEETYREHLNRLQIEIKELRERLSAQPEIILCKDCKNLFDEDACPLRTWRTHTEDDFCSYAERLKEEQC